MAGVPCICDLVAASVFPYPAGQMAGKRRSPQDAINCSPYPAGFNFNSAVELFAAARRIPE